MIGRLANESESYGALRGELLRAEMALRDQRERVAELRRRLPLDTVVEDYLLDEFTGAVRADGRGGELRLAELFDDPGKPLLLYQFMYGGAQSKPCSMCSMWVDGLNALAPHIAAWANFGLVARSGDAGMRDHARERGWTNLRLFSTAPSTFKRDFGFEDDQGRQWPGLSVFLRDADGTVRHFYSGSAIMDDAISQFRGLDLLCPVWHLMDLTPSGRGGWMPAGMG